MESVNSDMAHCTLLMITHNRREYTAQSLRQLLACEGDFSVWLWDNASSDGTAEVVQEWSTHPRVGRVFLSPENVMQIRPFQWMLRDSASPLVGKVDDDCLMPTRWIEPLAEALGEQPELGVIGCWTFWPEDFDAEAAAHKLRRVGRHQIVTNAYIGGTGVLVRRELCRRFPMHLPSAMPLDQFRMSAAGLINGWYYPLIWAEHMDDPRSARCALRQPEGMRGTYALTAKRRGHRTPEEYERWIREDCARILRHTTEEQLREWCLHRLRTAPRRAAGAARRIMRRVWQGAAK
jgi:hypothetical protein